jgi:acetyl-CoA decarbonylase/synthase complex subunit gamma
MKLAAKKADLTECPYASEEAKKILGAASEPPVKSVGLGNGGALKLGGETVLYRHEKTFVNKTVFAVNINDSDSLEEIEKTVKAIGGYSIDRVGETFRVEMISVTNKTMDKNAYSNLAKKISEDSGLPLVLRGKHTEALIEAAKALKGKGCVLASAIPENTEKLVSAAKENGHILAVTAPDLNGLVRLTEKIKAGDFNQMLLEFQTNSFAERFQINSIARRAAIKDDYKPLGYSKIQFIDEPELLPAAVEAVNEIDKYGGVCVLPYFDAALVSALITLRLNIYTDPQKPIQVEPKLYPIGEPTPDSPVFLTTNFSLTYFIVSGEIENSGTSAWLLIPQCEGMSVLTAWAAGKFSGVYIAKFMKEIGIEAQVQTRTIIIPGYVSQISGELEENMPGWKVMVGPQEAADIESFVKTRL